MKYNQSIRGMHDCLPKDAVIWKNIERILESVLNSYGYNEIRFPVVEFTNLFKRAIGEVTDVVEKEMYSFYDQHGHHLTLRPEGTAGCVRAGIEHSLFYHQEQRLWYLGPMFRHERPQQGRYRQFHQFGAEVFGQIGPDIDAEIILITVRCWKELGISPYLSLELNSIGLLSSRIAYKEKLIDFFKKHLDSLDSSSKRRLYSNPIRILDTKNEKMKELLVNAPKLSDYLDNDSRIHFENLCQLLNSLGVSYTINPCLVRGLDYYNRTVFEWVTNEFGVKKTICAGGRYDDLVKQLGGRWVPAIGFAIGLERILLLIKSINNVSLNKKINVDVYFINIGNDSQKEAILLSEYIRTELPFLQLKVNHGGGSLKQQFDRAIKNHAKFVLIINQQMLLKKMVILKDLSVGNQEILEYDKLIIKLNHILRK